MIHVSGSWGKVALKFQNASKELLEKHYDDLKSKPFFPSLIQYMSSGPVVPMVSDIGSLTSTLA